MFCCSLVGLLCAMLFDVGKVRVESDPISSMLLAVLEQMSNHKCEVHTLCPTRV